jgi:hypothetical protein
MLKNICFAIWLFTGSLFADVSQGETLERQMWENIKNQNYEAVKANISDIFQGIDFSGAISSKTHFDQIKSFSISDYSLSNMKVTSNSNAIVVTYEVNVAEQLEGKPISSNMPRISIWQNENGVWKWIAHANLAVPLE